MGECNVLLSIIYICIGIYIYHSEGENNFRKCERLKIQWNLYINKSDYLLGYRINSKTIFEY